MSYDHSDKKMFFFSLVGIAKFKYINQAVLEVDGNADKELLSLQRETFTVQRWWKVKFLSR